MTKEQLRLLKLKNKAIADHKKEVSTIEQLWLDGIDDLDKERKAMLDYADERFKEKMIDVNKGVYWEQLKLEFEND